MKTVLVTGGAGYIASHTNVLLLEKGYDVIVVDNYVNSSSVSIERVEKITGKKIKTYVADVKDANEMDKIFANNNIDFVIHFAGLKAVGESVSKPLEYYDNNLGSTIVLLETMKKYNVKNIIFSSSATVYGTPEKLPLTEECKIGGTTNPYGTSKLMIEHILQDLYKSDNSWNIMILRYFNPVGAHESGLIGEDPNGIPNNLMPYVAQVAVGKLPCINVFGNDYDTKDGTGVRDYIHVCDLAKGHLCALEHIDNCGLKIYNLGTGVGYSVLDMIHGFEKACGKQLPYKICPRRPGDLACVYASCDKAFKELGFKAEYDMEKMCSSQWKWQRLNPNGYKN